MSANIETMAFVGALPWHGIGTPVEANVGYLEMMKAAGLDWEVELKSLQTATVLPGGKIATLAVTSHKAVVRKQNGHSARVLGVVGNAFRPVQNVEAFQFLDSIRSEKKIEYHTAGSLGDGEKVWVLTKLPGDLRIGKSDLVEKFLLFSNSHDGGGACRVMFTPIRVVCQNTLNAAIGQVFGYKKTGTFGSKAKEGEEGVAIRHVGDMNRKLDLAAKTLGLAVNYYDTLQEQFAQMAATKITLAQFTTVVDEMFPLAEATQATSKVGNAGIRSRIAELLEAGPGAQFETSKGTAWGLYNAITRYVDHERTTTGKTDLEKTENRLKSQWFGSGARVKQDAFEKVMALC